MPGVTRIGDMNTGHDGCGARELVSGSGNVFANGMPVGRVGDTYSPHGCPAHPTHNDKIAVGSGTVRANGRQLGRVGDTVSLGGSVATGSGNVRAG